MKKTEGRVWPTLAVPGRKRFGISANSKVSARQLKCSSPREKSLLTKVQDAKENIGVSRAVSRIKKNLLEESIIYKIGTKIYVAHVIFLE